MCGRYAIAQEKIAIAKRYGVDAVSQILPDVSYNIRPTDQVPIVLDATKKRGERRLESARWSLIPAWSKEPTVNFPTFNARVETAAEKPSFKSSVRNRRCILPATGYYEWLTEGKTKTPYFVTHHESAQQLANPIPASDTAEPLPFLNLAGLYSWWKNPELPENHPDHWVLSATILTRPAAGDLADVHDRMPMMVPDNLLDPWLDPTVLGSQGFLDDFAAGTLSVTKGLTFYEVGPVRENDSSLIVPLTRL